VSAELEKPVRWRCLCAYDGTNYTGWQSQATGDAVQDVIEEALVATFDRHIRIVGAGRTDAGVHADGQVFHFDASWRHAPDNLRKALVTRLPEDVQVLNVCRSLANFHALRSAKGKRYLYRAVEGRARPREIRFVHSMGDRRMDLEAMRHGAAFLTGHHDFSAFAASRGRDDNEDPVKELWRLDVTRRGSRLEIAAEGSGFLYKMVRGIVGALFDVGIGKLQPEDLREILESRKRTYLIVTAPARGLTLSKTYYRRPRR